MGWELAKVSTFNYVSSYDLELWLDIGEVNHKTGKVYVGYEVLIRKKSGTGYYSGYPTSWSVSFDGSSWNGSITYDFRNYSSLTIKKGDKYVDVTGKRSVNLSAGVYADYSDGIGRATGATSRNLPQADRNPPRVSISSSAIGQRSIDYTIKTDSLLSDTQYRIEGKDWVKLGERPSGSKTNTAAGLIPNTAYVIQAWGRRKYNDVATYSNRLSFRTKPIPPSIPVVTLSNVKTNAITVTAKSTPGQNSPITGYDFYCNKTGWTGKQTSNVHTFTGLQPNTNHGFQVRVYSGDAAAPLNQGVYINTDTLSPVRGTASIGTITQKSIQVYHVGATAQAGIKEYRWYNGSTKIGTTEINTFTFPNLTPNVEYNFKSEVVDNKNRISAVNITATTLATPVHSPKLSLSATKCGEINAQVSAIAQAGIKNYALKVDGHTSNASGTGTSYTLKGLSDGLTYTVQLTVTDNQNNVITTRSSIRTMYSAPIAKDLSVFELTPHSIQIKYNSELYNAQLKAVRYYVNDYQWKSAPLSNNTLKIDNLEPNTTYTIGISLQNNENTWTDAPEPRITIKTLEDKWLHISTNGKDFIKCNAYIIEPNGNTTKIEKSKAHLIK